MDRNPYDAKHVAIVDMGGTVWALYIPDAEQAKDPRAVAANITSREYEAVEVVACVQRYYKRDGATVPGWVITSGPDYSDPIPNKPAMLRNLREHAIPGYFHQPAENTTTNTEEPKMSAATITDFKPGQQIIVANGTTQTVVKMADRIGNEPQRVEVQGGLQWLASECEPANDGTTYCGTCGDVFATTVALDAHQSATNHERFVVHQVGFNNFVVRDTRTELDAASSTSRSGARHIADCLTNGTMILDQLGRATVPQPATPETDERPACSHGIRLQPGVVLSYAKCEPGTQWGVFGDEGSIEVYDCAARAANRAAEFRAEDPDTEYGVWQVCNEHPDERYGACNECGDFS